MVLSFVHKGPEFRMGGKSFFSAEHLMGPERRPARGLAGCHGIETWKRVGITHGGIAGCRGLEPLVDPRPHRNGRGASLFAERCNVEITKRMKEHRLRHWLDAQASHTCDLIQSAEGAVFDAMTPVEIRLVCQSRLIR